MGGNTTTAWHLEHCLGINISATQCSDNPNLACGCAPHPCCPGKFIEYAQEEGKVVSPDPLKPYAGSDVFTYTLVDNCA